MKFEDFQDLGSESAVKVYSYYYILVIAVCAHLALSQPRTPVLCALGLCVKERSSE